MYILSKSIGLKKGQNFVLESFFLQVQKSGFYVGIIVLNSLKNNGIPRIVFPSL